MFACIEIYVLYIITLATFKGAQISFSIHCFHYSFKILYIKYFNFWNLFVLNWSEWLISYNDSFFHLYYHGITCWYYFMKRIWFTPMPYYIAFWRGRGSSLLSRRHRKSRYNWSALASCTHQQAIISNCQHSHLVKC